MILKFWRRARRFEEEQKRNERELQIAHETLADHDRRIRALEEEMDKAVGGIALDTLRRAKPDLYP